MSRYFHRTNTTTTEAIRASSWWLFRHAIPIALVALILLAVSCSNSPTFALWLTMWGSGEATIKVIESGLDRTACELLFQRKVRNLVESTKAADNQTLLLLAVYDDGVMFIPVTSADGRPSGGPTTRTRYLCLKTGTQPDSIGGAPGGQS